MDRREFLRVLGLAPLATKHYFFFGGVYRAFCVVEAVCIAYPRIPAILPRHSFGVVDCRIREGRQLSARSILITEA